jgi:hypothetical protein
MIDESRFTVAAEIPRTIVDRHTRDHVWEMRAMAADFISSFGWQQMYREEMLGLCPIAGIHVGLPPCGQLKGVVSPRAANATRPYSESMQLGDELLRMFAPQIDEGAVPPISQHASQRVAFPVRRARVDPYA